MAGKDYKIGISTTGDTSGAEEVEAALGQMEEAAAAVGKTAEEAFAAAKAALDPADWTLDELEKALKEINAELGKVPRGTQQYTELQKASKMVSDEIKTAKAGLKDQLDTLAATRVTGINQAAELFNKLTTQVGDFSDKLREAGFEEAADKIEGFARVLNRGVELTGIALGISLVVERLGGLRAILSSTTATVLKFIASPLGVFVAAAAAAALYLKNQMEGASEATREFFEASKGSTDFKEAAEDADALASGTAAAADAAERFATAQGEITKHLAASARMQERLNRTTEKIDDLQTESELAKLDASGLSPAAKAVERARIENAARERKRIREEKAEDDKIAEKEAMARQREGAAALNRDEAARLRGQMEPTELVDAARAAGEKARARVKEIDDKARKERGNVMTVEERAEFEARVGTEKANAQKEFVAAANLAQAERDRRAGILGPQVEGYEAQAKASAEEAGALRAEVERLKAERAAARPGERVAAGLEAANLTQAAQNAATQSGLQALDNLRQVAGNEFTAPEVVAEGIARIAAQLQSRNVRTASQFEGIMRSIAQLESAVAAMGETGLPKN